MLWVQRTFAELVVSILIDITLLIELTTERNIQAAFKPLCCVVTDVYIYARAICLRDTDHRIRGTTDSSCANSALAS